MKKSQKKPISDVELKNAIMKFIDGGGIIQQLPEQKTIKSSSVGSKYGSSKFSDLGS